MMSPGKYGSGEQHVDEEKLWNIFSYIGIKWETWDCCQLTRQMFRRIIKDKVKEHPRYAGYYQAVTTELDRLAKETGDPMKALEHLFHQAAEQAAGKTDRPGGNDPITAVISEFIKLHVAYGGFKTFNYMNYPGYFGGPYSDPQRLPYRGRQEND